MLLQVLASNVQPTPYNLQLNGPNHRSGMCLLRCCAVRVDYSQKRGNNIIHSRSTLGISAYLAGPSLEVHNKTRVIKGHQAKLGSPPKTKGTPSPLFLPSALPFPRITPQKGQSVSVARLVGADAGAAVDHFRYTLQSTEYLL